MMFSRSPLHFVSLCLIACLTIAPGLPREVIGEECVQSKKEARPAVKGDDKESEKELNSGSKEGGELKETGRRSYRLAGGSGDYVRGRLKGARMELALINRAGERERVLATGRGEEQEFQFVTGELEPYKLEVQSAAGGNYELQIETIVPAEKQTAGAELPESPRLKKLLQTLSQGGTTEGFWKEAEQGGGPLVEREGVVPPLPPGKVLVTFLFRGAKRGVRLWAAPSGDHEEMRRLENSDVWYRSFRVPQTSRIGYKLAPDVPLLNASPWIKRRAILATVQRDPLNPHSHPESGLSDKYAGESVLELPDAPKNPWIEANMKIPQGNVEWHRFESKILENTRDVVVYRPHGFDPNAGEHRCVVMFDGERYVDEVGVPVILDNLIAAGKIPPTTAILISNPSMTTRSNELPCNPKFTRFLAEELMPWGESQKVNAPRERTVIAGASYGGLAAVYSGFTHPELFGKVLSQSGSFWWSPGALPQNPGEVEPGWLIREIVSAEKQPIEVSLEVGTFEVGGPGVSLLDANRHLRDVLTAKGYPVQYHEYAGGHGYFYWRSTLAERLIGLLGEGRTTANPEGATR